MIKTYVLDACAVIALLKREAGAEKIEDILIKARQSLCNVIMNKYNLLEVYYGFRRSDGEGIAMQRLQAIKASPILIIDNLSDEVFEEAGRLKASYKMSLADSIVLAEGIVRNAVVVSSDHHEFDTVEQNEDISFLWVR